MAATLPAGELDIFPHQTHALIFRKPHMVALSMARFLDGDNPVKV
jgi:hypothetical protein